jgi:endo-1,4-beta-mannosidase
MPSSRTPRLVAAVAAALLVVVAVAVTVVVVTSRGADPAPTPWTATAPPPPAADGLGSDAPITVAGDRILRDGQPWWFAGYNSFVWSGDCGDDDERMSAEQVDAWFASMRQDGHGAVRLFFFSGWDVERLDAAVAAAQENDLYLVITLDDAIAGCGETEKDDEWFADQGERDAYRDHMVALLERYRGVGTIAWFEYFNEPDTDVAGLRPFVDEMGAIAEQVDPDRLWSTGTIAPYDGGPVSFRTLNESPHVDIASLHEYDEAEIESNHGPDTRQESAGKPVIVGEFGLFASPDGAGCTYAFPERADRIAAKLEAYTTVPGYVGALAWAWQPGGDEACEYGNLDADELAQDVLRTYRPPTDGS